MWAAARAPVPEARNAAGDLIARANAARDAGRYHAAADNYAAALHLAPDNAAIQIQCGHMRKESGDLAAAEAHYLHAARLTPDDPDLALQLGHFYKVAGRLNAAEAAYRRALALQPGWADPAGELAALLRTPARLLHALDAAALNNDGLVPELAPRTPDELRRTYVDRIEIRRLGARSERACGGVWKTLRGVEAIRGFCISSVPLHELHVLLDKQPVHREALHAADLGGGQGKHVFNIWHDFSGYLPGLHEIELQFTGAAQGVPAHREQVLVLPALMEADHPASDGVVDPPASGTRPLVEAINARPSVVRPASRALFDAPPRNVLVLRTDQLGDLVTSIPALLRLRELLPGARIVGLLTVANADLARTLGVFDEVITVDFPDDEVERRRIMPMEAQRALRDRLLPYRFDWAIDLAESGVSRPLLLLSGARFLYGFHDRDWPWLDGGFEGATHDPRNRLEMAPQSTKVLALIERLGAGLGGKAHVVRRGGLRREALAGFGVVQGVGYAVLHTGARIGFSRWPGYADLAALLLARTALHVVMVTDDAAQWAALPAALLESGRFRLLDRRLAFDELDALVQFCDVFVGNDSGPKHLAALRGAPVVSLHSARINWNEWGQELTGSIISRRVPCAGCAIYHDADECGKDWACIRLIRAEEVYQAVAALLEQADDLAPTQPQLLREA